MTDKKAFLLGCTLAALSSGALADWSDPSSGVVADSSLYSYNQVGLSLAPSARVSQSNDFDAEDSDGFVADFNGSIEVDQHLVLSNTK